MNAKSLLALVLACGAAAAFEANVEAADLCLITVPSVAMTAANLAGGDWRREFAFDHPQTSFTIWAQSQSVYQWVKSRAEFGDAKAQWVVAEGIIRERGPGSCGVRDWTEVEAWLRRSADQGYAPAKLRLAGLFWTRPFGLESPESKGIEMFGRADAWGDPVALLYMGLSYECGRGVSKDLGEAHKRFASAESQTRLASDQAAALVRTIAIRGIVSISDGVAAMQDVCGRPGERWALN